MLGDNGVFGASRGMVGPPLDILHNKGNEVGSRRQFDERNPNALSDPTLPTKEITRSVGGFGTGFPFCPPDEKIIIEGDKDQLKNQWNIFIGELETAHDSAHRFIGSNKFGLTFEQLLTRS